MIMRKLLAAVGLGAMTLFPAAAQADRRDDLRELRMLQRECQIELSQARSRRAYVSIQRHCAIEIAEARRELMRADRRYYYRYNRDNRYRYDNDDFDRDHDDDRDHD